MPTTPFYLDGAQKNERGQLKIMLRLSNKGKAYRYSTQQSVPMELWDVKKKRVKRHNKTDTRDHNAINNQLNHIETTALDWFERWLKEKKTPPSNEEFRSGVNEELGRITLEELSKPITLYEFWQQAMDNIEDSVSKLTLYTYGRTLRYIKDLASFSGTKAYNFSDITFSWYDKFFNYCTMERDLDPASIGSLTSKIKAILRRAEDRLQDVSIPSDYKRFKAVKDGYGEPVYLTIEELEKIKDLDLAGSPMDEVRDLFLIGAFTGYRYGDYSSITAANIQDNMPGRTPQKTIKHTKTGRKVYTPIHSVVSEILTKYNFSLPQGISNQHTNIYLKEIAKLAGIDAPTEKITCTKGVVSVEVVPKYEMITTHTARRSMATNHYLATGDIYLTMQFTGHKSVPTFLKYVRADNLTRMQSALKGNSFFSGDITDRS